MGIRELKNRLSEYLRLVRAGELVQVTDRGTVVAELRPAGHPAGGRQIHPGLLDLARSQQISLAEPNDPSLYAVAEEPLLQGVTAAELLDEERGDS